MTRHERRLRKARNDLARADRMMLRARRNLGDACCRLNSSAYAIKGECPTIGDAMYTIVRQAWEQCHGVGDLLEKLSSIARVMGVSK